MARTKATVRRLPTFIPASGQRIGNENIRGQRKALFKIKIVLPQKKTSRS